jgi:alanine dehydrogenase
MTKIGIIREGKSPPDKRVPLTPLQCKKIIALYPDTEIFVQPSVIRAIPDSSYAAAGIPLRDDLSVCDILMGVKEVPIQMLIPGKTYFFFSHTYKKQPYNRSLLQAILAKNISLVDYELLVSKGGKRLIGFGKYAGIVGCYNGMLAMGKKFGLFSLKAAHECADRKEVEEELKKVIFPENFKLVVTGGGRVAGGAKEILNLLPIKKVDPEAFLNQNFAEAVYTQLSVTDYNKKQDRGSFKTQEFYDHPERFDANFMRFAKVADMYVSCHYWDKRAPYIFSREDAKSPDFNLKIVSDISCDIDGPIASTLRPSTIEEPLYGYDRFSGKETDFLDSNAIGVMAVDNLPCELPKDASADFGEELIRNIFPELLGKQQSEIIENARESNFKGELTEKFKYLKAYVQGL